MCYERKKKAHCYICDQVGEKEVLKSIKGSDDFIHIECALLSPNVEVGSYSKMTFTLRTK